MEKLLNDLKNWVNGLFEKEKQPIPVRVPVKNQSNYPTR